MHTLHLTSEQVQVVRKALNLYARMGLGQLEITVTEFLSQHQLQEDPDDKLEEVAQLVHAIKAVLGHEPSGSWGLHNPNVSEDCREAWRIHCQLRMAPPPTTIAEPPPTTNSNHLLTRARAYREASRAAEAAGDNRKAMLYHTAAVRCESLAEQLPKLP